MNMFGSNKTALDSLFKNALWCMCMLTIIFFSNNSVACDSNQMPTENSTIISVSIDVADNSYVHSEESHDDCDGKCCHANCNCAHAASPIIWAFVSRDLTPFGLSSQSIYTFVNHYNFYTSSTLLRPPSHA